MGFNFKKKYGQNFLQDKSIINNIVNSIDASENDLIIEIGPGAGALTKELAKKDCYILAYEIDMDTMEYLSFLENDKVKIIYDDFLKRNIKEDIKDIPYDNLYIIGNLPYYITTPIITNIIESESEAKELIFMVQKEVAERFTAKVSTREYGSISVFLNYFYDIKKLFIVDRRKFYPVPNVDSAVVKLEKKEKIPVDIDKFNKIVRDSFKFKRKNLRNNLKGYDLKKIASILDDHGLTLDNRAENLNYIVFVDLANKY